MRTSWRPTALMRAGLIAAAFAAPASAAEVRLAVRTDLSSVDPHYHVYVPNRSASRHIFDSLTKLGPRGEVRPGLAESWRVLADDVWEFTLREGVTFHDGTKLEPDDVAFTIARAPAVPNSPSSYRQYTKRIDRVEVTGPRTLRIHTKGPAPTLLVDLEAISILSRKLAEGRPTADYNSGAAAIGTGPYRFVEWQAGRSLILARNPAYWGGAEPWDRVTIRPIANDGARVAAILSGDVDMIEGVPGVDRARLAAAANLALHECDAFRIIYLQMDSARDVSPGLRDANGGPLDRNPFKDARVRRAMSLAINRDGLVERLLSGQAKAAGQYVPSDVAGASANLPPLPFDPDRARALLKEAGWADGFSVSLAGSNDRYPNDAQVAQAIGQMYARVGIKTEVNTMPAGQLFSRGSKLEFSAILSGWVGNGEASSPLVALMATYDAKTGMGPSNRGRWSNPDYDAAIGAALRTLDDAKRNALYAKAAEIAVAEMGMIPVYFTINTWATRADLVYAARGDEASLAMGLRPK
ncbi:MAG: ABC transporter substrate-binding protein [Acetobacteraceae bacterium]|nr:ABC transporter substrate-binding protein [Acetobacteraceae bacterium]